ncbi:MAG: Uma2 family endonuclease [Leptolyngbyaceae cyanobacterium SL_1_1]|nr:Uma2 family endonuclease [Leptolyngbyaceae cyanobacterium SL_1_1]
MSFQEFLDWKPETGRYELHNGAVAEMQPTGPHEQVVGLLNRKLNVLIDQENLNVFIPNTALVRPLGTETGYKPDILMIDRAALAQEPPWERESVITLGSSVRLVVEVTSTNWPDDYARKFEDYEAMGIAEYWILDYRGLGGRRYIGSPKHQHSPTGCAHRAARNSENRGLQQSGAIGITTLGFSLIKELGQQR